MQLHKLRNLFHICEPGVFTVVPVTEVAMSTGSERAFLPVAKIPELPTTLLRILVLKPATCFW